MVSSPSPLPLPPSCALGRRRRRRSGGRSLSARQSKRYVSTAVAAEAEAASQQL